MEIVSSLRQNGLRGVHQWKKEMLQAIQDTNDTIEQMDASAIRMFTSGIKHFVPACAAMVDDFQEGVLSELQRAKTHVQNMNYKDLARLGTNLTGIVVGGVFGIVIVGGANAAAVGGVIGGCVLFGACKVGTKWTGYSLNTKRCIQTVGVVSAASAIGGVVCFALGAAISGPLLLGSVVGLALTGGVAVIGYLADTRDKNKEQEKENEEQKNEIAKLKRKIDLYEDRIARLERLLLNNSGRA